MNYKSDFLLSEYWSQVEKAHYNTSFWPERRADSIIKDYSEELSQDLDELGESKGNYKEKYITKFLAWIGAKSNCLSSAITGPARFPVRKAEKALNSERNRYDDWRNWREKYFNSVNRQRTLSPEEDMEILQKKLDELIILNENIKDANKVVKKWLKGDITDDEFKESIDKFNLSGHAKTHLSLLLRGEKYFGTFRTLGTNIKQAKERVEELKSRIENKKNWEDISFDGGYITVDNDRVKVFHDSKPDQSIIDQFKRNGFRWSRHWACWSRKHTDMAIRAARVICTPDEYQREIDSRTQKREEIKKKKQSKVEIAIEKYEAFFAFGNDQFDKQKKDGVKYASLGAGLVCPVDNVDSLLNELGLKRK